MAQRTDQTSAASQRDQLNVAIASIAPLVAGAFAVYGTPDTAVDMRQMANTLLPRIRLARSASFNVAHNYLQTAGVSIDLPDQPFDYRPQAIEKVLKRVTAEPIAEPAQATPQRLQLIQTKTTEQRVTAALERHAEQPARQLIEYAGDNDPKGAWIRVLTGPRSCAFCAMMASRPNGYKSKTSALMGGKHVRGRTMRNGRLERAYHDGCDCIVRFVTGRRDEGIAESDALYSKWYDLTHPDGDLYDPDDHRSDAKKFRSWWDRQVREGKTNDYVAASLRQAAA